MAVELYSGYDVDRVSVGTDLTGKEQCLVVDAVGGLAPAGANAEVIGVCLEGAAVGGTATIQWMGIARVKLAGTLVRGGSLASNAAGLGVAATTGQNSFGKAREGGVTGQVISVRLQRHVAL